MIVTTDRPLDRELAARHQLTLTCSDAGQPALASSVSVDISVRDVDDHAPQFTRSLYNCSVRENRQPLEVTRCPTARAQQLHCTKYPHIHRRYISRRVFPVLTEPLPCTFVSVPRRNTKRRPTFNVKDFIVLLLHNEYGACENSLSKLVST